MLINRRVFSIFAHKNPIPLSDLEDTEAPRAPMYYLGDHVAYKVSSSFK